MSYFFLIINKSVKKSRSKVTGVGATVTAATVIKRITKNADFGDK